MANIVTVPNSLGQADCSSSWLIKLNPSRLIWAAIRALRSARRGKLWVVLLGSNLQEGIAGFGLSIEMALRSFDKEYLRRLRPPPESAASRDGAVKFGRGYRAAA